MNEQGLIKRILEGDERAFVTLLDEYQARVYRLACRMVDPQDAEDVTQEAFVAIYKSLSSFDGRARLSTWIYRVTLNTCLMWKRRQKPQEISLEAGIEWASGEASVEDKAISQLHEDKIAAAIAQLDEAHRSVVILHEFHGLTYKEIAQTLNVPVGTVKSRMFNAFRTLRKMLPELQPEAAS